jgi:hypothetical protein
MQFMVSTAVSRCFTSGPAAWRLLCLEHGSKNQRLSPHMRPSSLLLVMRSALVSRIFPRHLFGSVANEVRPGSQSAAILLLEPISSLQESVFVERENASRAQQMLGNFVSVFVRGLT